MMDGVIECADIREGAAEAAERIEERGKETEIVDWLQPP